METKNEEVQQIVTRIRSGDHDAFGVLYDAWVRPIYRFIFFKVRSRETAEDLTSDCFLKVFQYIKKTSHTIENLRALVYQTARNNVIDYYRAHGRQRRQEEAADCGHEEKRTIEETIDRAMEMERVNEALFQLKDEWREVIVLHYIEGYSHQEIAEIVGKSPGAVRVTAHRAMDALKKILAQSGGNKK